MNTRFTCPSCNEKKTFTLFIDTTTGEHLPCQYGVCNRASKCNYHLNPYKEGYSKMIFENEMGEFKRQWTTVKPKPKAQPPAKPVSFILVDLFKASLKSYEANNFVKYLIELFSVDIVSQLISKYFIATSKHWNGATIFWQIDTQGKLRTGKIMLYSPTTGKRVKKPFDHITWVHTGIKQPEFNLQQCYFGEHLLKGNNKPVAIVESEKTAIIASVYLPQFIWLACGSLNNLNADKCKVLKGRRVTLYPDLNGFDKWKIKAQELASLARFTVSNLLENKATKAERQRGLDLADFLIKFDYKDFIEPQPPQPAPTVEPLPLASIFQPVIQNYQFPKPVPNFERPKPISWGNEIKELETFFADVQLLKKPVRLNQCSTITNVPLFIETHFATIKANDGKKIFIPFLHRLKELKQLLTIN